MPVAKEAEIEDNREGIPLAPFFSSRKKVY
jgi:hypothetical protein